MYILSVRTFNTKFPFCIIFNVLFVCFLSCNQIDHATGCLVKALPMWNQGLRVLYTEPIIIFFVQKLYNFKHSYWLYLLIKKAQFGFDLELDYATTYLIQWITGWSVMMNILMQIFPMKWDGDDLPLSGTLSTMILEDGSWWLG